MSKIMQVSTYDAENEVWNTPVDIGAKAENVEFTNGKNLQNIIGNYTDSQTITEKLIGFTGATVSTAGTSGSVPAPSAGEQNHYLAGDGNFKSSTSDLTAIFVSQDDASITDTITSGITSVSTLASGETHASLLNKTSGMFKNIRKLWNTVEDIDQANAGAHNAIYRGKYLGNTVTAQQYASIAAGTFEDLYIGDYWTINGVNWRIAAFDYWLGCGDTECTTHHVCLEPDTILYTAQMNTSDSTTGGYVGSRMYTTNLGTAKTTINTAFGTHVLQHRALLGNAVSNGHTTGWSWYDSTVELMSESMVYGHNVWGEWSGAASYETGINKNQLPLFALDPSKIIHRDSSGTRRYWWLSSVVYSTTFAVVGDGGCASTSYASAARGVVPIFAIC